MSDRNQRKLFGTDGVRGHWGEEPLTPECVARLGVAIARTLGGTRIQDSRAKTPARIFIGMDPRESSPAILSALSAGLSSHNMAAYNLGIITTPGVAYCVRNLGAAAGIMVSASHNPACDNGIKVFGPDGFKLADELEHQIEDHYFAHSAPDTLEGEALDATGHVQAYYDHLVANGRLHEDTPLKGRKIVLDCANGSASEIAPRVFRELGAEVEAIAANPDGQNINDNCGALHPEALAAEVTKRGADAGATFDGDADRLMLISENGDVLDGDYMLAIMAEALGADDALAGNAVVSTVMANLGLEQALKNHQVALLRTPVGDRYVVAEMLLKDLVLGGEQSGHIIHLARGSTTGDGIFNAVTLLEYCLRGGGKVSDYAAHVTKAPQILVNVRVTHKPELMEIEAVAAAVREAESVLSGSGRVLLRYSGTEPKARVMVEGLDKELIEAQANAIADAIRGAIGADS